MCSEIVCWQEFRERLVNTTEMLSENHLKEIRHSGMDVTRHVINCGRYLLLQWCTIKRFDTGRLSSIRTVEQSHTELCC